jgi:hypothetical protein
VRVTEACQIHEDVPTPCPYCAAVIASVRDEIASGPYRHGRAIREQMREQATARRREKPDSVFGAPRKLTPEVLVELTGLSLKWIRKLLDRGDTPHAIASGLHAKRRPAHCEPQTRALAAWRREQR